MRDSNPQGIAPNGFRDHRNSHSANPPSSGPEGTRTPNPQNAILVRYHCATGPLRCFIPQSKQVYTDPPVFDPEGLRPEWAAREVCPRKESDLYLGLRSPLFYPLNYEGRQSPRYLTLSINYENSTIKWLFRQPSVNNSIKYYWMETKHQEVAWMRITIMMIWVQTTTRLTINLTFKTINPAS